MNKSFIPELPKTIEELKSLFKKKFKILRTTEPVSVLTGEESCYGDQTIAYAKIECPLCGTQFEATIKSDLLGSIVDPDSCPGPDCDFSNNVV